MFKNIQRRFVMLPLFFLALFGFSSCDNTSSSSSMTIDQPFTGNYAITTTNTSKVENDSTSGSEKSFEGTIQFMDAQSFELKGTSYIKWPWQDEMRPQEVHEEGTYTTPKKGEITFIGDAPEPGYTLSGYYKIFIFDDAELAQEKLDSLPRELSYTWLENKKANIFILLIKTFFAEKAGL